MCTDSYMYLGFIFDEYANFRKVSEVFHMQGADHQTTLTLE